jgi:hypothetical protein
VTSHLHLRTDGPRHFSSWNARSSQWRRSTKPRLTTDGFLLGSCGGSSLDHFSGSTRDRRDHHRPMGVSKARKKQDQREGHRGRRAGTDALEALESAKTGTRPTIWGRMAQRRVAGCGLRASGNPSEIRPMGAARTSAGQSFSTSTSCLACYFLRRLGKSPRTYFLLPFYFFLHSCLLSCGPSLPLLNILLVAG